MPSGILFFAQFDDLISQILVVTDGFPEGLQLAVDGRFFVGIEAGCIKRINTMLDFEINNNTP